MKTDQIKNQIGQYLEQYQKHSGTFEAFRIIYEYVNFLKTEPYLKSLLGDIFTYAEQQQAMILKLNSEQKLDQYNISNFSPYNPPTFPFFQKEATLWQEKASKKETPEMLAMLPIALIDLMSVYDFIGRIKTEVKNNNLNKAKELTDSVQNLSIASLPMTAQDNNGHEVETKINTANFHLSCLATVSKYILDNIDSENFINNQQPEKAIDFDKDKSILYIRGQAIRMSLKNDKSTEHFILESILANPDKNEETYFKDIANDYIKIEEYDSSKDWQRFRHACDRLNRKVDNSTSGLIKDFIKYTTGKTGWCKINEKYL